MPASQEEQDSTKHRDSVRAKAQPTRYRLPGSGVEVTRWDEEDGKFHMSLSNSYLDKTSGEYKPTMSYSPLDSAALQNLLGIATADGMRLQAERKREASSNKAAA